MTTERVAGEYAVETCADAEEWDAFVERVDGPVYALRGWGDAVASYGHDTWYLVVRERASGDIVGALPLTHVESRLFRSKLLSPAFAVRGSTVLDGADVDGVRALLLERTRRLAAELDVGVVSLRGSQFPRTAGFVTKNRYVTFEVPVGRGVDAVWAGIDDDRREEITRALGDPSLRFSVGDSLADLRAFYRVYLAMMRDLGNPPHSFAFFRSLWDRFRDGGTLRLTMLRARGTLIAARIDLPFGSTVYQNCVVVHPDHRELPGRSVLLWKALTWAVENGYETYDLSRTREGSGAYAFKQSFGGSEVWYDDLHYFPDGTVGLSDPEDGTYRRARAVWRRLPLSVTRALGPLVRKQIGL